MKKGTFVKIKSNGHKAVLRRGFNKRSTYAYVWDFDSHCGYSVKVSDIIKIN